MNSEVDDSELKSSDACRMVQGVRPREVEWTSCAPPTEREAVQPVGEVRELEEDGLLDGMEVVGECPSQRGYGSADGRSWKWLPRTRGEKVVRYPSRPGVCEVFEDVFPWDPSVPRGRVPSASVRSGSPLGRGFVDTSRDEGWARLYVLLRVFFRVQKYC